ncbi:hypothetical protein DERP_013064 [Dermatophagoides pteronyssinus]|uniref:Uncharacterized protein n=1 Tax=Dermatophagoides pteronyssinus TaxID=6956 RepID=A0ABQ8JPV3_DERPT|nr:hypothetical protein DERP_013064 [Dermatophagoides pteronyssinus]
MILNVTNWNPFLSITFFGKCLIYNSNNNSEMRLNKNPFEIFEKKVSCNEDDVISHFLAAGKFIKILIHNF